MTQDEIIRMAREAGSIDSEDVILTVYAAFAAHEREKCETPTDQTVTKEYLRWLNKRPSIGGNEAWNAGVAYEREACAKVCERLISGDGICADDGVWIHDCAAAIRNRGDE